MKEKKALSELEFDCHFFFRENSTTHQKKKKEKSQHMGFSCFLSLNLNIKINMTM